MKTESRGTPARAAFSLVLAAAFAGALALGVAIKDGRIKRGDLIMLEAMGGGFTWGAALVRW